MDIPICPKCGETTKIWAVRSRPRTWDCACGTQFRWPLLTQSRGKIIEGTRFGALVVVGKVGISAGDHYHVIYSVKCDCGRETMTRGSSLMNGTTKSCGCRAHRYKSPWSSDILFA